MKKILVSALFFGSFCFVQAEDQADKSVPYETVAPDQVVGDPVVDDTIDQKVFDPFEPVNRAVFALNNGLDTVLLNPFATIYKDVTPQPVQTGLSNFLSNLWMPISMINSVLQGNSQNAGSNLLSFVVNTIFGFFGLIDVASCLEIESTKEDFGQTLGVWGMDSGPYLVLPIIGPSSVRDTFGMGVDIFADPISRVAAHNDKDGLTYTRGGLMLLTARAEHVETLQNLQDTSVDYYAAVRSLYLQNRFNKVHDGKLPVDQKGAEMFMNDDTL